MKTLEQLSKEAASALIFESVDTPQIEISISNPTSSDVYTIKVPKMFLVEFAKLVVENHITTRYSIENAADYIDRHVVESMKELAKEGFIPNTKNK